MEQEADRKKSRFIVKCVFGGKTPGAMPQAVSERRTFSAKNPLWDKTKVPYAGRCEHTILRAYIQEKKPYEHKTK